MTSLGGGKLGKKKSLSAKEPKVCRYKLGHESNRITMTADCKECQGKADLSETKCFSGILHGLSQEYNVDSIVLSHYVETKYTEDSMQMLQMMVEIVGDMEQMSMREPYDEYFKEDSKLTTSHKNQQKDSCKRCTLEPKRTFEKLKDIFLKDISSFYDELDTITDSVKKHENTECVNCIKDTKSDLVYLFNKLEKFRAYVIYKGFQIVI